jgi:type VI secretion system secreted protein Hcp
VAFDAFLKLDGVPGESADAKHKGEIEVLSFSFGVSQAGGAPTGGGGGAGKASFTDFHFTARTQKSSPRLFVACAAGEHFKKAVLALRKAGGKQQDYITITFSEVRITSYQAAGAAEADDGPLDQVSLGYGKIAIEYREQDPKGALAPPVKGGWDLKANKKV